MLFLLVNLDLMIGECLGTAVNADKPFFGLILLIGHPAMAVSATHGMPGACAHESQHKRVPRVHAHEPACTRASYVYMQVSRIYTHRCPVYTYMSQHTRVPCVYTRVSIRSYLVCTHV